MLSLFDRSRPRVSRRSPRRRGGPPRVDRLESRELLAVNIASNGNLLQITSDGASDFVEVRQNAANDFAVDVLVNGAAPVTVPLGVLGTIDFQGNGGNDGFVNNSFNPTYGYSRAATADGGSGNDWLQGNDQADVLSGGTGDDTLLGMAGNDTLSGDAGNDRLYGGDNNDYLVGGPDNDTLHGNAGNDVLFGLDGSDRLYGDEGNDYLDAGVIDSGESNYLRGGAGNDVLISSAHGSDSLYGEGGVDNFVVRTPIAYPYPGHLYPQLIWQNFAYRANQIVKDLGPGDVLSLGGFY